MAELNKNNRENRIIIEPAQRITRLPPYLFGRLNAIKLAKRQEGADIIDLGMGNPSDGAPQVVIDKLCEAVKDKRNHKYSASRGIKGLLIEIAKKYERKWNVTLDPEKEVLAMSSLDIPPVFYRFFNSRQGRMFIKLKGNPCIS